MIIRRPILDDLPRMVEEGHNFLHFVAPDKPVEYMHLSNVLRGFIEQGVVYIAERDSRIYGAIGGIVAPNLWWPSELDLTELFWWVDERHRRTSAGMRLFNQFVKHGKEDESISRIIMNMETISPLNDDVYTKRGFELKEKAFVMEV